MLLGAFVTITIKLQYQKKQSCLSMTSLPQLIKNVRKRSSLTQANFGQLFNPPVAQPTVARWEKGEQVPVKQTLS